MSLQNFETLNRRERRLRGIRRVGALALAGGVLLSGGLVSDALFAPAAQAYTPGPGINLGGGNMIGAFNHADGSLVYCVEMGKPIVLDGTINPAMGAISTLPAYSIGSFMIDGQTFGSASVPAVSGVTLSHINYIVSKWGQTADSNQAAAVQIAIWQLRAPGATGSYGSILSAMQGFAGAGVVALANQMTVEALNANTASSAPASPYFTETSPYAGFVNAAAGTTQLTLENAIFTDTGTNTITFPAPLTGPAQVPFIGLPPADLDSWDRFYTIALNGKYEVFVSGDSILYGNTGGAAEQGTVRGDGTPLAGDFDAVYIDPDTIWSPALTTQVPSVFVAEGEAFSDTVTFSVTEGSNPWREAILADGSKLFAPIKAKGKLYGPFLSDPALNPSATPPVGAPVAATAEVKTDTATGPGTYPVSSGVSREAGYYSWVWNIDFNDQLASVNAPANTGESSLPVQYFFTDGFGQVSEGQITPSSIEFSTQLSTNKVVIGDSFTDDVSIYLKKGGWLQTDGERTPFTLRGTAYTTDQKPSQQETAPADAEILTTVFLDVNNPDETFTSELMSVPLASDDNYVTMQWCLLDEDQADSARGKAVEFCDDFGVPSETAKIVHPEVTTKAQPVGAVKGNIHDTAMITGGVPTTAKTEVDFTLYLKPEAGKPKYDENWKPVLDDAGKPVLWTAAEVSDPDAVCTAQPVAKTDRVPVIGIGNVDSPAVKAETEGTGYWVESLIITPEGGDEMVIHTGECGLPNETTKIEKPKVTTKAVTEAFPGDEIFDTAIVDGPLSDREEISYEVTFEAYHRADGETTKPDEKLCTVDTKVWESTKPTDVATSGEYESEKWKVSEKHLGEILWVETLTMVEESDEGESRTEMHRGECGEVNEITKVKAPTVINKVLAVTGGTSSLAAIGGIGGLLLAAAGSMMVLAKRRRLAGAAEEVKIEELI